MTIEEKDYESTEIPELIQNLTDLPIEETDFLINHIIARINEAKIHYGNRVEIAELSSALKEQLVKINQVLKKIRSWEQNEVLELKAVRATLEEESIAEVKEGIELIETAICSEFKNPIKLCDSILNIFLRRLHPTAREIYKRYHAVLTELISRFEEEGIAQREYTRVEAMKKKQRELELIFESKKD